MNDDRKNNWRIVRKRQQILKDHDLIDERPSHYYAKNSPWKGYRHSPNKTNNKGSRRYISKNYKPSKNWNEHDSRRLDEMADQIEELTTND